MTILEPLQNVARGTFSRVELNSLIKYTAKISYVFTKRYYHKLSFGLPLGVFTLKDIALDAIVPLFIKNSNSDLAIVNALKNWETSIQTEDDAIIFLNKIVLKRTEQHISCVLQELDPLFGKILKSVNYHIQTKGYIKITYLGMTYICEDKTDLISGKVLCIESFNQLPSELFQPKTDLVIHTLFNYIKSQTDFFPAIPLFFLIYRLKDLVLSTNYDINCHVSNSSYLLELREVVDQGFMAANILLEMHYRRKNKLTNEEFDSLKSTLRSLCLDLQDGGINRGLYEYLKEHIPGLQRDEYYSKYQNILDYLLRIMKNTMAHELKVSK